MLRFYQIPCECGRIHDVARTQAGSAVTCECGKEVAIPTLRELSQFPTIERPEPQQEGKIQRPISGVRQRRSGLLFVLFTATILFAGLAGFYYYTCPQEPTIENAQSPFEVWQVWQTLRTGIDTPMSRAEMMRGHAIRMNWRWVALCGGASALCILGMFATLVVGVNKKKPNLEKE